MDELTYVPVWVSIHYKCRIECVIRVIVLSAVAKVLPISDPKSHRSPVLSPTFQPRSSRGLVAATKGCLSNWLRNFISFIKDFLFEMVWKKNLISLLWRKHFQKINFWSSFPGRKKKKCVSNIFPALEIFQQVLIFRAIYSQYLVAPITSTYLLSKEKVSIV